MTQRTNLVELADSEALLQKKLERILEHARRYAQDAEVYAVSSRSTSGDFEADRLKQVLARESTGVGIRLIKDGRMGISSTNDLEDVEGLVSRALETTAFGPQARFELPGPSQYPVVETYDPAVEQVSVETLIELGRTVISELKQVNGEVQYDGGVSVSRGVTWLMNTRGLSASYGETSAGMGIFGTLVRGTDMLFVGDGASSRSPISDVRSIIDTVKEQLAYAEDTVPAPTGRLPVLFTPRAVAGLLLAPLLSGLNGRNVYRETSPLAGRLGEQVFDPRFSLIDDATTPYRPANRPFDDEGVPSRRLPLVEGGVVANFFYDLQTAGEAGAQSTGSASRGLANAPGPSTSYLLLPGGETPVRDMLASIQDGLLVERFIGAGQGNVLGGDAGGNVLLGYRVQNGQVTGRVKDTMLNCNIYHILKDIGAISRETLDLRGSFTAPYLLCQDVSVSGKG